MNDTERAALVDKAKLADRIAALISLRTQWSPIDRALEIIDTVTESLTDRAVAVDPDEDAVERAARAIHAIDAGLFPDYVRQIPARSVYLDRARAALQAAAPSPAWSLESVEAMLDNPEVVAALGRRFAKQRNGESDYDSRPSYRSFCDGEAVTEVESALADIRNVLFAAKAAQEGESHADPH